MKISIVEGGIYSLMVGLGETYLVAFALSLGIAEAQASYLGILPTILGGFLQFGLSYLTQWSPKPRRWLYICSAGQSLALFLIALTGVLPLQQVSVNLLGGLAAIYWMFGYAAGPVWNRMLVRSLAADQVVPFFYHRNAVNQIATILSLILAALILGELRVDSHESTYLLSLLLFIAAALRAASGILFVFHPFDESGLPKITQHESFRKWLLKPFVFSSLVIMFLTNLAVFISAPFFSPYMLKSLNLSMLEFNILLGAALVCRTGAGYVFNGIIVRSGAKLLLATGTLLICPVPYLWTLSDNFTYLIVLQLLTGLAWGAQELGLTLSIIENVPEAIRSRLLTWSNLVVGLGSLAGVAIGSLLLSGSSISQSQYHELFTASSVARILPFVLIFFIIKNVPGRPLLFRNLGIRPSGRGMSKPVLLPTKKSREASFAGESPAP